MSRLDEYLEIPIVTDSTVTSSILSGTQVNACMFIQFFDANGLQVLPVQGTATFQASEDNFNYATVSNGEVDITTPDYNRPIVQGCPIRYLRVILETVQAGDAVTGLVTLQRY